MPTASVPAPTRAPLSHAGRVGDAHDPVARLGPDPVRPLVERVVERVVERLIERLRIPNHHRATALKVTRCMAVSVGTTLLSAVVLVTLAIGLGVPAGVANVVGTLCGIGPSYVWNRRYAWRRDGRGDPRREVLPFWVLSLTGLVVSTFAVDRMADLAGAWPDAVRALALPVANIGVFAVLWVVQFVVLDRVIFSAATDPDSARQDSADQDSARQDGARQDSTVG